MSITIAGRTIVFDYGEVISRSPDPASREAIVAAAGIGTTASIGAAGGAPSTDDAVATFWRAYDANRDELDSGDLSVVDYWRRIEAATGSTWSPSKLHELWVLDFTSWFIPEPGTLDLLAELREGGTSLALLSNAGFDFGGPFRYSPMGRFFDHVFVSAELHDLKPRASIYKHVLAELGIAPAEMVFVDNKAVNVEAAESLGITGHVFVDPASLRTFLETLAS